MPIREIKCWDDAGNWDSPQSLLFDSLFAGMAATIMGGLFVATILTMCVLPVVYALFYKIRFTVKN